MFREGISQIQADTEGGKTAVELLGQGTRKCSELRGEQCHKLIKGDRLK